MLGPSDTVYHKGQWVYWRCKYCPRKYRESSGTTIIANHLESHNIHFEKDQTTTNQQRSIIIAFPHRKHSQTKGRRIADDLVNIDTLKQVLVRWIARYSVSFQTIERPKFRDILYLLNLDIK